MYVETWGKFLTFVVFGVLYYHNQLISLSPRQH